MILTNKIDENTAISCRRCALQHKFTEYFIKVALLLSMNLNTIERRGMVIYYGTKEAEKIYERHNYTQIIQFFTQEISP